MRIVGAGHAVFAAVLVALGLLGLVHPDYVGLWQGVPKGWPAHEAIAIVCALVSLGSGLGLFWRRAVAPAAGVLTAWLVLWLLTVKATSVIAAHGAVGAWDGAGETVVLIAAALALFADFSDRANGVRGARVLYSVSMIVFGVAHLTYLSFTGALVPAWLPSHAAWVYLTGFAYIAAGAAILTGVAARLAAVLSALQMGLFTLLVWVPVAVSGHAGASDWSETTVSVALTAAGWVIADTYRRAPWLALSRRRPLAV